MNRASCVRLLAAEGAGALRLVRLQQALHSARRAPSRGRQSAVWRENCDLGPWRRATCR